MTLGVNEELVLALNSDVPNLAAAASFIKDGADVNVMCGDFDDMPLLHMLAQQGYVTSVVFLLAQSGIKINAVDDQGLNALQSIVTLDTRKLRDVAAILIDGGIDLNHKDHHGWDIFRGLEYAINISDTTISNSIETYQSIFERCSEKKRQDYARFVAQSAIEMKIDGKPTRRFMPTLKKQ